MEFFEIFLFKQDLILIWPDEEYLGDPSNQVTMTLDLCDRFLCQTFHLVID
jgi:hypothetical protein